MFFISIVRGFNRGTRIVKIHLSPTVETVGYVEIKYDFIDERNIVLSSIKILQKRLNRQFVAF